MYRLTNLTLDTTITYKNKDLVYQALERENAKVKHQEAEGMLLVEELDKKGVVIAQEDIYLPFDGIADSLFLTGQPVTPSETVKKGKSLPFLKTSRDTDGQEPGQKEKQALREPLSDTKIQLDKRKKSFFLFLKVLWQVLLLAGILISFGIAGFTISIAIKQGEQLANLSQQVKQLESLQLESGKLDTFARYFLPRYYSEQGNLEDFISPELDLKGQPGQLQSVILEAVTQTEEGTYQLTYVLAIRDGDSRKQKRLRLTVKEETSALYGYQVIKVPEQTPYPN